MTTTADETLNLLPEHITVRHVAVAPKAIEALDKLYRMAEAAGIPEHLNSMAEARAILDFMRQ